MSGESMERIQGFARGPKGDKGERGTRGLSLLQGRAVVFMFAAAVALSVFAIFWVSHAVSSAQQAQRRAGQQTGRELCSTFGRLAGLSPPAGSPGANPSRAYLQRQHAILSEVGTDLGCR